ncbi:hypothetical protein D3C74_432450 [compost metagenome]
MWVLGRAVMTTRTAEVRTSTGTSTTGARLVSPLTATDALTSFQTPSTRAWTRRFWAQLAVEPSR